MTSVMEANAEALFTNRSLEEIREVEVRTRREANEKAEAVRWDSRRASERASAFVRAVRVGGWTDETRRRARDDASCADRKLLGESYKDAVASLEALRVIEETSKEFDETVREIEAGLVEARAGGGWEAVTAEGRTERRGEAEETRRADAERGSRVKFLLDTPEKIWGLLEECAYDDASTRLSASMQILTSMTRDKKSAAATFARFPVVRQQANVLGSFRAHVSKRAREGLERSNLRAADVASALKAIIAVENLDSKRALTMLLQTRQAWVRACLRDIASSSVNPDALIKRLAALMKDVKHVLSLAFDVFAGAEALLVSGDSDKSADDVFHGVFEPQAEWDEFQAAAAQRKDKLEVLSESFVRDTCLAWLDRLAEDIAQRGVAVFGKMSNCEELTALEAAFSEDEKEWNDASVKLFKRKLDLWSTLFEQPWLQQGFNLFRKALSFSHIKPMVDSALAESSKGTNESRKESSMWTSSSAQKDDVANVPEDIRCAQNVARSMNKTMLSVRRDALMLQGIQLGGTADLEGRLSKLADHIHSCAYKGLVDFAKYLLSKTGEHAEVSGALMIGHLARACVELVKEMNVLLKPANLWPKYNDSSELIIKPARTLRGMQRAKEPVNKNIEDVTSELDKAMKAGYKVWVEKCSADTIRGFKESLRADVSLVSDAIPPHWERVGDKSGEGLSLKLPATPSSYVLSSLHGALQEVQRVGGHLLPRSAIQMLASSIADGVLKVYEDGLARSRHSEKGTLQVLLDVKFTMDVLALEDQSRLEALQKQLTNTFDPIDWATYEPYLWGNERRSYRRCAVLLGGFVQLSNLYQDASIKTTNASSTSPATPVARFTYLPVSLPTLRGVHAERGKGKIDWGEIEPAAVEDEEREGILSSFMQSSRIGLGNILREFA